MPYHLLYDRAQRVLVIRFGNALNQASYAAMREAVKRFAAREGRCRAILDLSAVERTDFTARFVANMASSGPVIADEMRVIVAAKPEIFGLSRMYELHQVSTTGNTLVVRALEDAYRALGVQALDAKPVDAGGTG